MNTLIINGSPRKNGNTAFLINEMIKNLNGNVKIVNAYYDNISPCTDCRYCYENDNCIINDEMQKIYKNINEADNIILASPVYFSELTGQLLNFASRLQLYYVLKYKQNKNILKSKNGALIITAGGSTKDFSCVIKRADIIFSQINTKSIGTVLSSNTDNIATKDDLNAFEKVLDISKKLNELY